MKRISIISGYMSEKKRSNEDTGSAGAKKAKSDKQDFETLFDTCVSNLSAIIDCIRPSRCPPYRARICVPLTSLCLLSLKKDCLAELPSEVGQDVVKYIDRMIHYTTFGKAAFSLVLQGQPDRDRSDELCI